MDLLRDPHGNNLWILLQEIPFCIQFYKKILANFLYLIIDKSSYSIHEDLFPQVNSFSYEILPKTCCKYFIFNRVKSANVHADLFPQLTYQGIFSIHK